MAVFDRDIRKVLLAQLRSEHANDSSTLILEELPICDGGARVDIAVLNGSLAGFEIKSERDTLGRLESQIGSYIRCFDCLTLVAPARHLNRANDLLPPWWGLLEVTAERAGTWELKAWRKPKANKSVEAFSISGLLWRAELLAILERRKLDRGIRSKPMRDARLRLVDNLNVDEIREEVRQALKARGDWRSGPTPFRGDGYYRSSATVRGCLANRRWLLSFQSPDLPR